MDETQASFYTHCPRNTIIEGWWKFDPPSHCYVMQFFSGPTYPVLHLENHPNAPNTVICKIEYTDPNHKDMKISYSWTRTQLNLGRTGVVRVSELINGADTGIILLICLTEGPEKPFPRNPRWYMEGELNTFGDDLAGSRRKRDNDPSFRCTSRSKSGADAGRGRSRAPRAVCTYRNPANDPAGDGGAPGANDAYATADDEDDGGNVSPSPRARRSVSPSTRGRRGGLQRLQTSPPPFALNVQVVSVEVVEQPPAPASLAEDRVAKTLRQYTDATEKHAQACAAVRALRKQTQEASALANRAHVALEEAKLAYHAAQSAADADEADEVVIVSGSVDCAGVQPRDA